MKALLTDYEQRIVDCVETAGCFVVSVLPDEEAGDPPFSYSVGFTKSLGQPEVTFFGLPGNTAHSLVNDLFRMCSEGLALSEGLPIENLVANYPVVPRTVHESWIVQSYFASALWYHRTQMNEAFRHAMQVVWPDPDGAFPWEEGCADWVRMDQPALYRPRLAT